MSLAADTSDKRPATSGSRNSAESLAPPSSSAHEIPRLASAVASPSTTVVPANLTPLADARQNGRRTTWYTITELPTPHAPLHDNRKQQDELQPRVTRDPARREDLRPERRASRQLMNAPNASTSRLNHECRQPRIARYARCGRPRWNRLAASPT